MRRILFTGLAFIALAIASSTPEPARAGRTLAGCTAPTKVSTVTDTDGLSTFSDTNVLLPGSKVTFATSVKGCVFVTFSGLAYAPGDGGLFMTVLLDNNPSNDGEIQFQNK